MAASTANGKLSSLVVYKLEKDITSTANGKSITVVDVVDISCSHNKTTTNGKVARFELSMVAANEKVTANGKSSTHFDEVAASNGIAKSDKSPSTWV